jgi:hypothetical protein
LPTRATARIFGHRIPVSTSGITRLTDRADKDVGGKATNAHRAIADVSSRRRGHLIVRCDKPAGSPPRELSAAGDACVYF